MKTCGERREVLEIACFIKVICPHSPELPDLWEAREGYLVMFDRIGYERNVIVSLWRCL